MVSRFGWWVPAFMSCLGVPLAACSDTGTQVDSPTASAVGSLRSLAVSPLDLSPAFAPDVHDYVVRCAAGDNALSLALMAVPDATISVTTPAATLSGVSQGVSVTLSEDDPVIVETTTARGALEKYWVRCLPHDFPAIAFTSHPDAGTPTPGWYLTGNATVAAGESGFAMILDGNGTPVWYQRVGPKGVMNVDRLPSGSVSYVATLGAYGSDPNAEYVIQKLDPWQTRYVQAAALPTDEHELQVLPDGDVLVFSYPFVEDVDLSGLGYGSSATIADCLIQELSPSGDLVWSWQGTDHIDPVRESTGPQVNLIDGLQVVDVFHFNSIDVDAKGNLLVSARDMDAIWYIDKASGTIVWKMGGAPYSKDGAQIIRIVGDAETTFNHQHDARFQPNGDVTLFDDHTNIEGVARGVEYAIDFASGTATPVWQYAASVNTTAMGSFRRYPDGSNVIAWGLSPKNPATFTEVDDAGNDVLDVAIGNGDSAYRTVKVPVPTFDVDVLRVTAGHS